MNEVDQLDSHIVIASSAVTPIHHRGDDMPTTRVEEVRGRGAEAVAVSTYLAGECQDKPPCAADIISLARVMFLAAVDVSDLASSSPRGRSRSRSRITVELLGN